MSKQADATRSLKRTNSPELLAKMDCLHSLVDFSFNVSEWPRQTILRYVLLRSRRPYCSRSSPRGFPIRRRRSTAPRRREPAGWRTRASLSRPRIGATHASKDTRCCTWLSGLLHTSRQLVRPRRQASDETCSVVRVEFPVQFRHWGLQGEARDSLCWSLCWSLFRVFPVASRPSNMVLHTPPHQFCTVGAASCACTFSAPLAA